MKTLYILLLTLLCWTDIKAQEREYAPMLREDLVWVGNCYFGSYRIQVEGDTVVNGVTYKKVYRRLNGGTYPPVHDMQRIANVTLSESTPVACVRENNGKVYRLCETTVYNGDNYNCDWDDPDSPEFNKRYSLIENETDTHYEAVIYDYANPNIYIWTLHQHELHHTRNVPLNGEELRVFKDNDATHPGEDDGSDSWYYQYINYNEAMLMVEGMGMLRGGKQGRDWLCPCRAQNERKAMDLWRLGIDYVRDSKGIVLVYEDHRYVGVNDNPNREIVGDPYDFDNDVNFDIGDVNAMINIMLRKQQDDSSLSADLTFDGSVDIEDMNLVINRLLSDVKPVKYSELLAPEAE